MGSQTAQENVLYLYDTLLLTDCAENSTTISLYSDSKSMKKNISKTTSHKRIVQHSYFYPKLFQDKSHENDSKNENFTTPTTNNGSTTNNDTTFSSKMYVLSSDAKEHSSKEISACRRYLKTMSKVRLVQLANAGNLYAARKLADNIMEASSKNVLDRNVSVDSKRAARQV